MKVATNRLSARESQYAILLIVSVGNDQLVFADAVGSETTFLLFFEQFFSQEG